MWPQTVMSCSTIHISWVKYTKWKSIYMIFISIFAQIQGSQNACSVLPWPTRILSLYCTFIDRGNWTKPASMSEWFRSYTWDQASLLKLGQTSVTFVFSHWTLSLFHVSTDLIHFYLSHVLYMFHTVRPKRVVSVN